MELNCLKGNCQGKWPRFMLRLTAATLLHYTVKETKRELPLSDVGDLIAELTRIHGLSTLIMAADRTLSTNIRASSTSFKWILQTIFPSESEYKLVTQQILPTYFYWNEKSSRPLKGFEEKHEILKTALKTQIFKRIVFGTREQKLLKEWKMLPSLNRNPILNFLIEESSEYLGFARSHKLKS